MFEFLSLIQLFWTLFIFRYLRYIVNCIAYWTFKPIPIPAEPSYTAQDVTIIIPTIDGDDEKLRSTIESCLRTEPYEIILTTIDASLSRANAMVEGMPSKKRIRVVNSSAANKRRQLCRAIPEVTTKITVLADDDVVWPRRLMSWILAPFEDSEMGGVGTNQRLWRDPKASFFSWYWFGSFFGALYLQRRNFDIAACTHMDGGLPCLSGRTVAYRTHILQEDEFTWGFTHEKWRTFHLNADDDNFITRWMVSHGWKTYVQFHKEAEVLTTLETGWKYLKQCLRWSRSNWRSNLRSMFVERHIWRQQPWSTYAVHQTTLTAWAPGWDIGLTYLLWRAMENWSSDDFQFYMSVWMVWLFLSKVIKLLPHYVRYPVDIFLIPCSILFGQFHSVFIKTYALLTLNVTSWGSREGADRDDASRLVRLRPEPPIPEGSYHDEK